MDGTLDPTRRTVLIGAGMGGGALLLAACSGSSGGTDDPVVTTSAEASPAGTTSTPTTAAPTTAAPTAPPLTGTTIAALSAVPVGGGIRTTDNSGQPIIVAQPAAGTVVAFSAVCTHMQCTVNAPEGDSITCMCHGSMFQTSTGNVTRSPATAALPSVAVNVVDGNIVQP